MENSCYKKKEVNNNLNKYKYTYKKNKEWI
jgi:hypothetical protein